MVADVYNPLNEYKAVFHDKFKEVAGRTFDGLAAEAHIDVEANQKTCKKIYETEDRLKALQKQKRKWRLLCIVLWFCIAACVLSVCVAFKSLYADRPGMLAVIGGVFVLALVVLCKVVYPKLKKLKHEKKRLSAVLTELQEEAWRQMKPLNDLYDWDILPRMMSETVPKLAFDPYFNQQRLADLKTTYGWDDSFNRDRSVIYAHSGLIHGNPFVFCRTLKMKMGSKDYTGTKTIHWTTTIRGADGRYQTVSHSETLVATVTAPYPEYFEKTRLFYANKAAPDLVFHRKQSGLATKMHSMSYKRTRRSLRKKANNLKQADFAMLSNEEFEVAFDTRDRNNNQQYALLFTPMAQENMLLLLRDKEVGYGDDFDFEKNKMLNTIQPEHLQHCNLELNPKQYHHFDFDKAQSVFYSVSAEAFRAIYFSLAPLLCIPLYQQLRPEEEIYGRGMKPRSTFWEHESLANFWGENHFKHPDCATRCILKTQELRNRDEQSEIKVHAHGFSRNKRISYVNKWGGDGRMHQIAVHWDEYLPVTGSGSFCMQEDNSPEEATVTPCGRIEHIRNVLDASQFQIYRRHIASKI